MEREGSMDREARELSGVARGQNILYLLPHDAAAIRQFLEPVLDKLDPGAAETAVLVVTPDADTAVELARTASGFGADGSARVVPVTGIRRTTRLLRSAPAQVLAGTPADLLELIRGSSLKLVGVRTLVLAWVDAILDGGGAESLEAVLAEVPRDAARVVVTSQLTPAVEEVAERYARRARRVGDVAPWEGSPVDVRYVSASLFSRSTVLRRLLDELDPPSAAVYVRSDAAERDVRALLRALGYAEDSGAIRITRGDPVPDAALVILYDLPASRDGLRALLGDSPRDVIALAQPRQIAVVRWLAGGGRVSSLTLAEAAERARRREEAVRSELRTVLTEGAPARELLTIEPLLQDFDGVEVAAAALRLLERERERQTRVVSAPAPAAAPWTRVYINAGARDNVAPRDLVGAISGEAGIRSDRIGKIELRDNHSLVEIASPDADAVVRKLTGTTVRGRRLVARLDNDRPPRQGSRERGRPGGQPRNDESATPSRTRRPPRT